MQFTPQPRFLTLGLATLVATAAFWLAPPTARAVDVTWNFDGATPLSASTGAGTIAYRDVFGTGWGPTTTTFGTSASFGLPAFPNGGSGGVMSFPATSPEEGYQVNHSGGGGDAYTMIWDFLSPASSDGRWRALYQSDLTNSNDGEFFILDSPSGGIGISGSYQGSIVPNAWNRIAVTREANGTMSKFINGALVGTQSSDDPRFGNAEIQLLTAIPGNLSDANLLALKASGVDGLSIGDGSITQEVINAFHRNGMWVDVFTVNSPARMEQLIDMGVDSIETDRPDLMADVIFAGDVDNDFDVDGADFLSWQRQGNFAANLAAWKKTYGHKQGSLPANAVPFASAVPEPTTAALFLLAAAALSPRFFKPGARHAT